jgi:pyruvate dehydrogenase E1 component alpha subunit
MHIFSKHHFYGGHGIVGGNSCRNGISFADKYFETNAVTLTYFGDGAAQVLHEAFNMAMLWKLPVVLSLKITVTRWELL